MPILRNHISIAVARSLKAFVNFEAGITKGDIPDSFPENGRNGKASKAARSTGNPGGSGVEKPPMFFLVGQAKSGTSWLMRLLHTHPEILCRGEGKLFGKDNARSLHGSLAHSKQLDLWLRRNPWTHTDRDPDLEEILREMIEYLMARKLSRTNKRIVGDKTPFQTTQDVAEIARICPGSKVIHIVRDGRDVAVSTAHHLWNNVKGEKREDAGNRLTDQQLAKREAFRVDPSAFGAGGESLFAEGQLEQLADGWSSRVGDAIHDGERLLGKDYLQISYEDMLVRPIENAGKAIRFLGADASESVVRECVEEVSFEKKANNRKPGEEDNTSFYRKGIAGDWKGSFTEEDRRVYKQAAGERLVELGYEKDNEW